MPTTKDFKQGHHSADQMDDLNLDCIASTPPLEGDDRENVPPAVVQLHILTTVLSALRLRVIELEQRLHGVLSNGGSLAQSCLSKQEPGSPLTYNLIGKIKDVENIDSMVLDILNRLEI